MRLTRSAASQRQLQLLRRQFLQDGQLPFTEVLTEESLAQTLSTIKFVWKDRIYTPLVTLWVFLGQVLSADHSCRAAVARLLAHRVSRGETACSAETGAYCQARKRLPLKFFSAVARLVGKTLDDQAHPEWLWKGRSVYMFDGTTVMMPDTPENQKAYPQLYNQRPGCGFPIARIVSIISLACGSVLDLEISRYSGKKQGELSLLRQMWDRFQSGDVLLGDRMLCSWTELLLLKQRGVASVARLNRRQADFRKGIRLGKGDHIVRWQKPSSIRSVDWKTYKSLPDFLTVRETRVHVRQRGFRSRTIIVVTTLLDAEEITASDLAELYRARWHHELDLRSIKVTLQMDFLRCKTPELVHQEIWTHILAYNLIRTVMAQAADSCDVPPRTISFKGALQTLAAFQPLIAFQDHRSGSFRSELYQHILQAISTHRVGDRPDRIEPRQRKYHGRKADRMTAPRHVLKRAILKGVRKN